MTELSLKESVRQAVLVLHGTHDRKARREADKWLIQFSSSKEAWNIAEDLLNDGEVSVRFFGASTLYKKIKKNWNDLDTATISRLQVSLPQLVCLYSNDTPAIRNLLTLACATHAVKNLHNWPSFFNDVFTTISNPPTGSNSVNIRICMVTLLGFLAEEQKIITEEQSRKLVKQELQKNISHVLEIIVVIFKEYQNEPLLVKAAFECLEKWSSTGVTVKMLLHYNLFGTLYEALKDKTYCNPASAVLGKVLEAAGTASQNPRFREGMYDPEIEAKTFEFILSLKPLYHHALTDKQKDTARALVKILSGFGCSNVEILSRGLESKYISEFLAFAMECTLHPDRWIAEYMLDFWMFLSQKFKHAGIYEQLFSVLLKQCAYPDDYVIDDEETTETMRSFRKASIRILRSIYGIIQEKYLLYLKLGMNNSSSWTAIESIFFCLIAVGPILSRSPENSRQLGQNFVSKSLLLPDHPILKATSYSLVDYFSGSFLENKEILPQIMNFTFLGMLHSEKYVSHEAGKALKSLCLDCAELLVPTLEGLMGEFTKALPQLRSKEQRNTVEGLIAIIYKMPPPQIQLGILYLVNPIAQRITLCLSQPISDKNRKAMANNLRNLCCCVIGGEIQIDQHPVVAVLQSNWNLLLQVQQIWINDQHEEHNVINNLYEIYNTAIRTTQYQYEPLLDATIFEIVSNFDKSLNPVVLGTTKTLIAVFGKKPQYCNVLRELICQISSKLFTVLEKENIANFPDHIDHYYQVLLEACLCSRDLLYQTGSIGLLTNSILLATKCIEKTEMVSLRAMLLFLEQIFLENKEKELGRVLLEQLGLPLVGSLLEAIVTTGHFRLLSQESKILFNLMTSAREMMQVLLMNVFSNIQHPIGRLPVNQKNFLFECIQRIVNTVTSEEKYNLAQPKFLEFMRDLNSLLNNTKSFEAVVTTAQNLTTFLTK